MNPKLVNITFKTKDGIYVAEKIVVPSDKKEVIENDVHVMFRCFKDKLEGFKKGLVVNPKTKLPHIERIEYLRELGLDNC